jgi:hypothetical protein
MLLDRPACFLYRHQRNLYLPMLAFAAEYRWIVRIGVVAAAALLARLVMLLPFVQSH